MTCGGKVVSVLEGGYGCRVDMSKPGAFGTRPAAPHSPADITAASGIQRAQLDRVSLIVNHQSFDCITTSLSQSHTFPPPSS
jgi:hypothetical protein